MQIHLGSIWNIENAREKKVKRKTRWKKKKKEKEKTIFFLMFGYMI